MDHRGQARPLAAPAKFSAPRTAAGLMASSATPRPRLCVASPPVPQGGGRARFGRLSSWSLGGIRRRNRHLAPASGPSAAVTTRIPKETSGGPLARRGRSNLLICRPRRDMNVQNVLAPAAGFGAVGPVWSWTGVGLSGSPRESERGGLGEAPETQRNRGRHSPGLSVRAGITPHFQQRGWSV